MNWMDEIFHTFVIESKKTGKTFEFKQIGVTREAAKEILLKYNLADLNWSRWTLREED